MGFRNLSFEQSLKAFSPISNKQTVKIIRDPVKQCQVYKEIGCSHVDGYLCNMKECSILNSYILKDKTK